MNAHMSRRRFLAGAALGLPLVAGGSLALLHQLAPDPRDLSRDLPVPLPLAPKRPTDRMVVKGRPSFWAGVNYPWKTGQDFGTGAWGHSGVSDPTTYQEVDVDFANIAAQGVR